MKTSALNRSGKKLRGGLSIAVAFMHLGGAWAASETSTNVNGGSMRIVPGSSPPATALPVPDLPVAVDDDLQRAVARVKAEYLYRFLGYVDFPRAMLPQPDTALVIGVTGADDVFDALADTLSMRTVGSRPVVRRRMNAGDSLHGVHMLYAGRKVDLQHDPLVINCRSSHVLLVTDTPGGLGAGAVFNFLMMGEQLRFEASLEAANRAALQVSSRVLVLAERVIGVR